MNIRSSRVGKSRMKRALPVAIALATLISMAIPSLAAATTLQGAAHTRSFHGRNVGPGYGRVPRNADPAPEYLPDPGECVEDDGQGRFTPCDGAGG